jgi:uncharacterized protein
MEFAMLSLFLPLEGNFFELYDQLAEQIVKGARETRSLLKELPRSESRFAKVKDIEHAGDEIAHRTIALLRKTFITPLDRNDMHRLISEMDTILDIIDATAQRIFLFELTAVPQEMHSLADVCVEVTGHVQKAVRGLSNLKDPDLVMSSCVEIDRLENQADRLLRSGLAQLFRQETDTLTLIKVKEIYELLESITNRCEDVANTMDRIVLEHF